ncbi:hypothetical protein PBRA_006541 [Plasmodiophora brassicae]|nr:hypothetical protein PBRA_006541 [Plasmodiophora brassicae]
MASELFAGSGPCAEQTITSTWRDLKRGQQHDASCQTNAFPTGDREGQSVDRVDLATQTERVVGAACSTSVPGAADASRLVKFVRYASRLVDDELEKGLDLPADLFDDLADLSRDTGEATTAEVAYLLRDASSPPLPITCITWNASGHVVACAFGAVNHAGWCRHTSRVSTWNLAKVSIDPSRPDRILPLDCCACTAAFHPEHPSLLAVGLFTGQITLHDAEDNMTKSPVDEIAGHREPITGLAWVRQRQSWHLASVSGDGRVLLWTMENGLAFPVAGARLVPTAMYHGHGILPNKAPVLGGAALAFCPFIEGLSVVGTECGGVLRCVLTCADRRRPDVREGSFTWAAHALALVASNFDVKRHVERDAVLRGLKRIGADDVFQSRPPASKLFPSACSLAYEPHIGPVNSVAFSPLHRNLFVTCSSDGYVRVYNSMRMAPLVVLQPGQRSTDAKWSPTRSLVVAVGDATGVVHVYDLQASLHSACMSISANTTSAEITSVAFSGSDGRTLACADTTGCIVVWALSARLAVPQPHEYELAEQWANVEHDEHLPTVA